MKWVVKHEGEVKTDHTNKSKNRALVQTNRACITAMTETLLLLVSRSERGHDNSSGS